MRPNAYGSSTIGVKKSAVWTIARSSRTRTTPAPSAPAAEASTRGSEGIGSVATIGPSSAAPILQPQPAPCDREVRAGGMRDLYCRAVPFSDAEVEAAVRRLEEPGRLD